MVRQKRFGGIILILAVVLLLILLFWRQRRPGIMRAVPVDSSLFFLSADAGRLLDDPFFLEEDLPGSLGADLAALRSLWQEIDSIYSGRSVPLLLHYHASGPDGPSIGAIFQLDGARVDPAVLAGGSSVRRTEYRGQDVFTGRRNGQSLVVARVGSLLLAGRFPFLVEEGIGQLGRPRRAELPPVSRLPEADVLQLFVRQEKLGALFGGPFAGQPFFPEGWWRLILQEDAAGMTWEGRFWAAEEPPPDTWLSTKPVGAILEAIPESPAFVALTGQAQSGSNGALLDSVSNGELALVVPSIAGSWESSDRLAIVGLREAALAGTLAALADRTGLLEEFDYQTFTVRRLLTGLPPLSELDGTAYAFQNPYVVQLGEYLIFSASRSAIELWIDRQVLGATLARSPVFLEFLAANKGAAGAFIYGDPLSLRLMLEETPPGRWLGHLMSSFKAVGGFAGSQGWSGYWPRDTASEVRTDFLWRRRLAAPVATAPQVVRWADGELSIAASDEEGTFYFLDPDGEILWTTALDGPLLSKVTLIDYYGDGQQQLLFNTRQSVYLLDRRGRAAGAFPFRLQSAARAGLTLAAFSGPRDYGIFIPCANGYIYGFDERQLPLSGWNPGDSIGAPAGSILHFQFDNKDFLVGLGVDGILRVYDRQGRLRFLPDTLGARAGSPPAVEIEGRRALIAAADRQGNVVLHRPERTPSRLRLRTQANAMLFAFADVVGDERKDYIALSGRRLTVHAYEGGRLRRKTDRRLPIAPDTLFTLSIPDLPRQAVGTLSAHRHQIHLFDGEGRLFPGFPLAGATAFTIVDLFGDGRRIVLVGEGDGVYAYVAGTE